MAASRRSPAHHASACSHAAGGRRRRVRALAISFWFLQIVQHAQFREMAENNHQRTLALRAPRGVLFDRNGKVLVENRHSLHLSIVREHTKDLDRTIRSARRGRRSRRRSRCEQIVERHRGEPAYRPIVVVEDASLAQVAAITAPAPRLRAAGRRRRGSADAAVPDRRAGRAPVRLRRRGQRRAGRRRRPQRRDRRPVGHRDRSTTSC